MVIIIASTTLFALAMHCLACMGARDVAKSDLAGRGLAVLLSAAFFLGAFAFISLAAIIQMASAHRFDFPLIILLILGFFTLLVGLLGISTSSAAHVAARLPAYIATPVLAVIIIINQSSRSAPPIGLDQLLAGALFITAIIFARRAQRHRHRLNLLQRLAWEKQQANLHAQRWRNPSPDLIETGSVFFEDPPTLIRPRCTRWAFSTMALANAALHTRGEPFDLFTLRGPIEGRSARATIRFQGERLIEITLDQIESLRPETPSGQHAEPDEAAEWLAARLNTPLEPLADHPTIKLVRMKWGVVRVEPIPGSIAARVHLLFQSLESPS